MPKRNETNTVPKKKKRISLKPLLLLVLIVVTFLIIFFKFLKKPEVWPVYQNARYNFSLNYPIGWELAPPPTNNDGREFISLDKKISCRAYGFYNALENEQGEPQTLDEYITWLVQDTGLTVLSKNSTTLANLPAIEIVYQQDDKVHQVVYILDEETGHGLYCMFNNLNEKNRFQKTFQKMVASFKITKP